MGSFFKVLYEVKNLDVRSIFLHPPFCMFFKEDENSMSKLSPLKILLEMKVIDWSFRTATGELHLVLVPKGINPMNLKKQ